MWFLPSPGVSSVPPLVLELTTLSFRVLDSERRVSESPGGAIGVSFRYGRIRGVKPKVFLSHSSGDAEAVDMFRGQAAAAGMEVYLAEHDVQPGESLAEKVQKAIRRSDAIVVLLTKSGAASAYVHQEVGVAIEAGKPVIPIVEKGVSNLAMLGGIEYVSFDTAHPEGAIRDLTKFLTGLANRMRQDEVRARQQQQVEMLVLLALLVLVVVALSADS